MLSLPNIPNITPTISLNRAGAVNLLLSSIALEELGLAHLINAEAEKIQAVLGTLRGVSVPVTDIGQLQSVNESVHQMLRTTTEKEMLLQFKLEDVLRIQPGPPTPPIQIFENTAVVRGFYASTEVSDSSTAFYHRLVS